MFPLSSGWSLTHHNYKNFALIAKFLNEYYMVQIKLSLPFILAVAAIAPALALPVPARKNIRHVNPAPIVRRPRPPRPHAPLPASPGPSDPVPPIHSTAEKNKESPQQTPPPLLLAPLSPPPLEKSPGNSKALSPLELSPLKELPEGNKVSPSPSPSPFSYFNTDISHLMPPNAIPAGPLTPPVEGSPKKPPSPLGGSPVHMSSGPGSPMDVGSPHNSPGPGSPMDVSLGSPMDVSLGSPVHMSSGPGSPVHMSPGSPMHI